MNHHPISGVQGMLMLVAFGIAVCLYFLPTIIALKRNSPKTAAVVILNFFLGFSGIGWIIALILAFKQPDQIIIQHRYYQQPSPTRPA
jgi:RsiW-degrading membrane proteinase PrsW (M82 family)